ncbi:MAG TPA: SDR family oxidoreductase [Bryobacteraceae bacterium]|nr:SDR family oxidoreductase [Bryobacteraceae bacterium]
MRIVITGNMGYVGPCVVRQLRAAIPEAKLIGFDAGYFAPCLVDGLVLPERHLTAQYFGDVRDVPPDLLRQTDAVVHLAGVSNDPIGKAYERVTDEINTQATVRLAQEARKAGVRSFVFASSCSVYGCAESTARSEDSELGPLTAYARSKVAAEMGLAGIASADFTVTCLRFATACGYSPRLRLDLVLNDFVATALREGTVKILSDGTPWRPLIHVTDMARAIEWAIGRKGDSFLAVNAGSDEWNWQVADLAEAVAARIPGVRISLNRDAGPDKRSYKVSFARFRAMAPAHQPLMSLSGAIDDMVSKLRALDSRDWERRETFVRLAFLARLADAGRIDSDLRWSESVSDGLRALSRALEGSVQPQPARVEAFV